MTYIPALDPNSFENLAAEAAYEANVEWLDANVPGWEDREAERFIAYNDVEDPERGVVLGFGGDHRRYFPGAHE